MLSASSILYDGEQKTRMDNFLKSNIVPFVDKHYWLPLYQMAMNHEHIKKVMGYVPRRETWPG